MAADVTLYNQDYGQRIQLDTWCSDITTATSQFIRWRLEDSTRTYILTATVVPTAELDKLAKRAIVATIPSNWLKDKLGLWHVQAELRWGDAVISGKPITVEVRRKPSMTTTTTTTTTTTSTTTTTTVAP